MSSRSDYDLLLDILESIRRINLYIDDLKYEEFMADVKTQDAVIRALEILGEASKKVSLPIKDRSVDIPWKSMAGLRDKLIHDYFGVNLDIVWEVVIVDLPILTPRVETLLDAEELAE